MPETFAAFEREIGRFPAAVRERLANLPKWCGALSAADVQRAKDALAVDTTQLMVQLLPVAAAFARAPVSDFCVGAVAAGLPTATGAVALYLGANVEVAGRDLGLTTHAEQAAAVNAWLNGEAGLSSLAVSAVPCGYCRQFLYELNRAAVLKVVRTDSRPPGYDSKPLSELLPEAFGPSDMGIEDAFMTLDHGRTDLLISGSDPDDLRMEALHAARASYAPYTGAFAGCAIQTAGGQVYVGRGVENAAFNPSLAAVQVAFSMMNMSLGRCELTAVTRIVLVERATTITQLPLTESFVRALAPQAKLEYCRAIATKRSC